MNVLGFIAVLLAAPPGAAEDSRVPVVTSSAAFARAPKMVVLFRRYDAYFPVSCVSGGKLRAGDACLSLLPRTPTVRLMDGRRVTLAPLAKHAVSAWDGPERKGWAVPQTNGDAPAAPVETELAVWPPDANPGLEPVSSAPATLDLEGLRALPETESLPSVKNGKEPPWPPVITQTVALARQGVVAVLAGGRRGLYLQTPAGKWRAVRPESAAEVGTTIIGRTDLDGDGRPEWLIHIVGWNEFGLEVRPSDFGKPLFVFNDCGV